MARTAPSKNIIQIREFTKRVSNNISNWLPSIGGDFENTFTLEGSNVVPQTGEAIGASSKKEINTITIFGNGVDKKGKKIENSSILEPFNLNRFYLFLYCLRENPFPFDNITNTLNYNLDDILFIDSLRVFLEQQQTGQGFYPGTVGLTTDIVRYYRGTKLKDIKEDKDIASLLDYAKSSQEYKKNVVGVLGRVTYDSIVKQTLYSLLLKNGIIQSDYEKSIGTSWIDEAAKLEPDQIGFFIDPTGGTYSRAFPVVCVYTKTSSNKDPDSVIELTNQFISSKLFREVGGKDGKGKNELVEVIKNNGQPVGGEKNFIEIPNRDSGDSLYCVIYDFTKIIVLDPISNEDYTLDLLKIALSFLSRKQKTFYTKSEFISFYKSVKKFVESSFDEEIEKIDFYVLLKKKHAEECAYAINQEKSNFTSKLDAKFKAELKLLTDTLDKVYSKIINIFDQQTKKGGKQNFQFKNYPEDLEYPIILHFDNFYNLLAVTSVNIAPQENKISYDENIPFDISLYATEYVSTDLIKKFFNSTETNEKLPTIPPNTIDTKCDYQFTPSIAFDQDIVLITDIFLRQTYENMSQSTSKPGLVYDNDLNQLEDKALSSESISLTELINKRTKITIPKEKIFINSNNKIYLKKEVVKKISVEDFIFLFQANKIDKIKFQTINHLLWLNLQELKVRSLTIDDFKNRIYYPLLGEISPGGGGDDGGGDEPTPKKNRDFLINNIISSEFKCYEDISNSFDKAINAEKTQDKVYYAFQTLVNIGLPILLALSAQQIADKLAKLKKNGTPINPSLLECLLSDTDKLKKSIIGYADLISNLDNSTELLGLLNQGVFEIPNIPAVAFLTTFDAEKELKRRLLNYVVNLILKKLSDQLKISIRSLIDMCNADSYLTAFLATAFPSDKDSGQKLGSPTASGMIAGSIPTTYTPTIIADINTLIDESKIETRQNVYQFFREKYPLNGEQFSDTEISDFFDYLSNSVDASEMASLLKDSSISELRSTIVSYIKNYSNTKFFKTIYDSSSVSDLFIFLSQYIDYKLCYGAFGSSLINYSANVCLDIDSNYNENALKFGESAVEDQIADLTKTLDEICRSKNSLTLDILSGGPTLMTKKLNKSLVDAYTQTIKNVIGTSEDNSKDIKLDNKNLNFAVQKVLDTYGKIYTAEKLAEINSIFSGFSTKINFEEIKNNFYKIPEEKQKEEFNNKLNNSGNIGLKTEITSITGYVRKYQDFKNQKIKVK